VIDDDDQEDDVNEDKVNRLGAADLANFAKAVRT
jgi:hypothetical protein